MHTLLLKTDESVLEQIKAFLTLIPKEKLEVIDPFEVGAVSEEERLEIINIINDPEYQEMDETTKTTYTL